MFNKQLTLFISSFVLITIFFTSCRKDEPQPPPEPLSAQYIHISHTRSGNNDAMDSLAESIDYSQFDMIWLGGDLMYITSQTEESMMYVDSVFDVGNKNTLWALGNHDYPYLNTIEDFTYREAFYAYHKNGITFIVMDTQDSFSNIVGYQKDLFDAVTDSITESSHLILLHHKLIWMYGNDDLEYQIPDISNGPPGDCFYCINPNNFYEDIYPKLLKVKQRGIEVLCIAGDIGTKTNEFEYETPDGIHFLASGIKYNIDEKKALLFNHDITNKQLSWSYTLLSDIISGD